MVDVLSGRAQNLPYDLSTEQSRLARRKALIDSMLKQSQQAYSPVIDAGAVKVANWGDAVGRVADVIGASRAEKDVQAQEAQLAKDYNERYSKGVQDFMRTNTGGPGTTGAGVTGSLDQQDMPIGRPTEGPNPIKAITDALSSNIPGLQNLGNEQFKELTKGMLTPESFLKYGHSFDKDAMAEYARTGDPSVLVGRGKVEKYGDVALPTKDETTGTPQAVNTYSPKQLDPATGVPTQVNPLTGKEEGVTGLTSPPAKSGAQALWDTALGDYAKELPVGKQKAVEAVQRLPALQSAMQLTDQLNSGTPWSGLEQTAKKVLVGLGVSDDQLGSVTSTEQFNALMSQTALKVVQALRPASNIDLKYGMNIAGTATISDPRTAKVMVSLAAAEAANTLMQHQQNVDRIDTFTGKPGYDDIKGIKALYEVPFSLNPKTIGNLGIKADSNNIFSSALMGAMPGQPGAPPAPAPAPAAAPVAPAPPKANPQAIVDELRRRGMKIQ